jgi:hypothetical protein
LAHDGILSQEDAMKGTGTTGLSEERIGIKLNKEAKRIWDVIAAAQEKTRDQSLLEEGLVVLDRLREEGKLP